MNTCIFSICKWDPVFEIKYLLYSLNFKTSKLKWSYNAILFIHIQGKTRVHIPPSSPFSHNSRAFRTSNFFISLYSQHLPPPAPIPFSYFSTLNFVNVACFERVCALETFSEKFFFKKASGISMLVCADTARIIQRFN